MEITNRQSLQVHGLIGSTNLYFECICSFHTNRPSSNRAKSADLWKKLVAANRIEWTRGYLEGVIDAEIDFPVLDNDIFVHVAPELSPNTFELPVSN